jgi:hypothetical protein
LKSKTPKFWKQVQKLAISIGVSAVAVLMADKYFSLELPVTILSVVKYSVAICAAIAGTAQFTKEDQSNA